MKKKIYLPRLLEGQAEHATPILYTHYDCWNATGDDSRPRWKHNSKKAAELAEKLVLNMLTDPLMPDGPEAKHGLEILAYCDRHLYKQLGQVRFMAMVARGLVALGFCVYDGDDFLEAYWPKHCPPLTDEEWIDAAVPLLRTAYRADAVGIQAKLLLEAYDG